MEYSVCIDKLKDLEDKTIRLACALQLKILIFVFKSNKKVFSDKEASFYLNIDVRDINEAAEFWIKSKVIKRIFSAEKTEKLETPEKETINLGIPKLGCVDYFTERIKECGEVSVLLNEIQNILGRTLSGGDISVFISLNDKEGLPYGVILMLVQYCVKIGKGFTRYIEKVGLNWADLDINSIELAEKRIKYIENIKSLWGRLEKIVGLTHRNPTAKEEETVSRWFEKWKFDDEMVKAAYERCVDSKGKFSLAYMDGIIKRWKKEQITDICALRKKDMARNKNMNYKKPSYNLEDYENLSLKNFRKMKV
jgi:DnaD/phage-associated family protein